MSKSVSRITSVKKIRAGLMQVELTDEEIEFLRYVMIAAPKVYVIRSYCFPRNLD
ncbi:MAG: hypothetical protein ACTSO3_16700 [Candidatus Heimdallarchaeaceae archaeon]